MEAHGAPGSKKAPKSNPGRDPKSIKSPPGDPWGTQVVRRAPQTSILSPKGSQNDAKSDILDLKMVSKLKQNGCQNHPSSNTKRGDTSADPKQNPANPTD